MKGLLAKDFKLVKLQKNFFFVIFAIAIGLTVSNDDAAFLPGYLTFVMSMFTLSTISYDEFDNGNAFLFTLPISRKSYVVEKYVFSLLLGGGSCILATLSAIILSVMKGTVSILEILMASLMILPITLIIQALMIPFHLKFGREKGRLAIIAAFGLLFIIGFLVVKLAELSGIDLPNIINNLTAVNMGMSVAIAVAFAVIIFLVSMKISIAIMNSKEF